MSKNSVLKKPKVEMLSVDRIIPSADNKRRSMSRASIQSLAQSLKRRGMLQPIIVRPHSSESGRFEIRAGERRWRAAKAAKLTHVPAIIASMDDSTALSVTITENSERKNLHPLEEAATMQVALDRGEDIKVVAANLGTSVQHVARRASLTRLTNGWQDAVLDGESDVSRLSVAHLEQIARLPAETQSMLAENDFERVFRFGFPTVAVLERIIDGELHSLRAMPWSLDDESLDAKAGSCMACLKRSGKEPLLFGEEDASSNGKVTKSDRCLDPICYDRKHIAHVSRCEARLREDHKNLVLVQVSINGLSDAGRETFGDRVRQVLIDSPVSAKHPLALPAMPIDGPKAGTLVYLPLKNVDQVKARGRGAKARDADGRIIPLTIKERRERLKRRREVLVVRKVEGFLRKLTPADLAKTVANIEKRTDSSARAFDVQSLVLAFGTVTRADSVANGSGWTEYDRSREKSSELRDAEGLHQVVQIWQRRIAHTDGTSASAHLADARRMCEILGIDLESFAAAAQQEIPEPAAWARLSDKTSNLRFQPRRNIPHATARRAKGR
jgi:ParB/RepB/Spo0J family partition protein